MSNIDRYKPWPITNDTTSHWTDWHRHESCKKLYLLWMDWENWIGHKVVARYPSVREESRKQRRRGNLNKDGKNCIIHRWIQGRDTTYKCNKNCFVDVDEKKGRCSWENRWYRIQISMIVHIEWSYVDREPMKPLMMKTSLQESVWIVESVEIMLEYKSEEEYVSDRSGERGV